MDASAFDTSALTRPLSAEEGAEFRRAAASGRLGRRETWVIWAVAAALGIPVAVFGILAAVGLSHADRPDFRQVGMFGVVGLLAGGCFVLLLLATNLPGLLRGQRLVPNRRDFAKAQDRLFRVGLFARDNGLVFHRSSADPGFPGLLFARGRDRARLDHLTSDAGLLADAGDLTYRVGSGDDASSSTWQYLAFRLPRPVPHILLATATDEGRPLPIGKHDLGSDQLVRLGEPFDSRFSTFAPDGYAADTFRIFPPNVQAGLMDLPGRYDVELTGRWLFLVGQKGLDLGDAATWRMIEEFQNRVVAPIADPSGAYVDDRVLASPGAPTTPTIAPQGRRLRRAPLYGLLVAAGIGLLYLLGNLAFGLLAAYLAR